jgi:hypothetical protein
LLRTFGALHQWLQTLSPAAYPAWSDALKESFAPEAVAPDFPLGAGGLLGLRPRAFYATSSDLVAINNVLRSRTKWSLLRIPQE